MKRFFLSTLVATFAMTFGACSNVESIANGKVLGVYSDTIQNVSNSARFFEGDSETGVTKDQKIGRCCDFLFAIDFIESNEPNRLESATQGSYLHALNLVIKEDKPNKLTFFLCNSLFLANKFKIPFSQLLHPNFGLGDQEEYKSVIEKAGANFENELYLQNLFLLKLYASISFHLIGYW